MEIAMRSVLDRKILTLSEAVHGEGAIAEIHHENKASGEGCNALGTSSFSRPVRSLWWRSTLAPSHCGRRIPY